MPIERNSTRTVPIGSTVIGGGNPLVVQSMCTTHTRDAEATAKQATELSEAGAGIVRVAVDNKKDAQALEAIRDNCDANLSVDLQENYRLAASVARFVDKVRYNPGHLYHHEKNKPIEDKVRFLVDVAAENDCAIRVGVNSGSVDPEMKEKFSPDDAVSPMVSSALAHCEILDRIGFDRFCVSLKSSHPDRVIEANKSFASQRPEIPIHLGVTEAGMPPDGIIKTRIAFEQLFAAGIGDTVRVSLTLPEAEKYKEILAGQEIIDDFLAGRVRTVVKFNPDALNIISCPSCSRVENEAFIDLARQVKEITEDLKDEAITIAVMGCRVNGPGETDDADLGLWCGPNYVNLKRGEEKVGAFRYDVILDHLQFEIEKLLSDRNRTA
ncbi:MAG: (E)-4-hydroxy-3-methylbut-2-enyl-diphosphate synthase [Acidiferrobacterales bacterium]|nr:(E)-4-hydroxy-3-methylbut-2-enyl-diphosphate synthase [Acidiferrobacterales bacterium]